MRAYAFAPGHITGLFAVHDEAEDPMQKGSRGAGWSLDRGAHAAVEVAKETSVTMDGVAVDAPVTQDGLARLAPGQGFAVEIVTQLPLGQGFGMSAAGTLASCLAATSLLHLPPEEALSATHLAEVNHGTGLGDALGSWLGGGELRVKPGCPPAGGAMQVAPTEGQAFVLAVLGEPMETAGFLADPARRAATQEYGDAAVDRILDAGRDQAWARILTESAVFSHRLGAMPEPMLALGERLPEGIQWGQCMLGSAMWVAGTGGDLDRGEALLEDVAPFRCRVDRQGARLTRGLPPRND